MAERLLTFESRDKNTLPPPKRAKKCLASDFTRPITTRQQLCPGCKEDLIVLHGWRVKCDCGTIVEVFGNAMRYWRPRFAIKR